MEQKTKIHVEPGTQSLLITREFDLPLRLLFLAYIEPELIEQWMGTKVLKLENRNHGGYQFLTTDPAGNEYRFNGTIHEIIPEQRITRTFEMENTTFPVQLEFLEFEKRTDDTSRLTITMVFKSSDAREALLKLPFAFGLNWAHNRLEETAKKLI